LKIATIGRQFAVSRKLMAAGFPDVDSLSRM